MSTEIESQTYYAIPISLADCLYMHTHVHQSLKKNSPQSIDSSSFPSLQSLVPSHIARNVMQTGVPLPQRSSLGWQVHWSTQSRRLSDVSAGIIEIPLSEGYIITA